MVKILAFHLPQYHAFKENDAWWGEGFTDWVNVKKSKALFSAHNQPRVPVDGYYDMLEKKTHIRQAQLAKEYSIDGFCYYHYWFDGKLLMEKPLEKILEEKDVDLPFCMCWANEPWTRSWDGKSKEVIMPQRYGNEKEWKEHIDYLLPFFQDERYIKVDKKPLFVLYRTNHINRCDEMIQYWDRICQEAGLAGIYVVEENNNFQEGSACAHSSAILDFEPGYTRSFDKTTVVKIKNKLSSFLGKKYSLFSYQDTCEHMIQRDVKKEDKPHFLGCFTGWDNTPRRNEGGTIAQDASPALFEHYLRIQIQRSEAFGNSFLFVNAWNEWAEGAYLEPDTKYGYAYLEAVRNAKELEHD
ncbi:MAG: glycoside hydrolase family 99-like domain-containing protein [Bacillota bacterium]|nr:glycoside hydrolase family 99-like domain-containing protein [Bacillota bacterium]